MDMAPTFGKAGSLVLDAAARHGCSASRAAEYGQRADEVVDQIHAMATRHWSEHKASGEVDFDVALGIFRGHHHACPEEAFMDRILPLARYLVLHGGGVCAGGPDAAVAVFTELACLDAALGPE